MMSMLSCRAVALREGGWGFPDDVGKAVARGDMPYSTGQVIMVDGGMTIPRL